MSYDHFIGHAPYKIRGAMTQARCCQICSFL